MKSKILGIMALTVLAVSSCKTPDMMVTTKTATTIDVGTAVHSATVADMKVGDRISYTMVPTKEVQNGGEANVKSAAEAEALEKLGGNADLLLEPQYVIQKKNGKIVSITVSGRPATFVNFRSLPDSLVANSAYRAYRPVARPAVGAAAAPRNLNPVDEALRRLGIGSAPRSREDAAAGAAPRQVERRVKAPRVKGARAGRLSPVLEYFGGYGYGEANTGVNLLFNYHFNNHWAAGVGVGYNYFTYDELKSVPLFLNARYSFSPKAKTWFAEARLGGNIHCGSDGYSCNEYGSGVHFGLGLGYHWKYFEMALRYSLNGTGCDCYDGDYYDPWYGWRDYSCGKSSTAHTVALSLGFTF